MNIVFSAIVTSVMVPFVATKRLKVHKDPIAKGGPKCIMNCLCYQVLPNVILVEVSASLSSFESRWEETRSSFRAGDQQLLDYIDTSLRRSHVVFFATPGFVNETYHPSIRNRDPPYPRNRSPR